MGIFIQLIDKEYCNYNILNNLKINIPHFFTLKINFKSVFDIRVKIEGKILWVSSMLLAPY